MKDAVGTQIGWQVHTSADVSNPLNVKSKLEDVFVLTPKERNSYIQFALGGQSWASNQIFGANDVPWCSVGGYDGSDYPAVSHRSQLLSSCMLTKPSPVRWTASSIASEVAARSPTDLDLSLIP